MQHAREYLKTMRNLPTQQFVGSAVCGFAFGARTSRREMGAAAWRRARSIGSPSPCRRCFELSEGLACARDYVVGQIMSVINCDLLIGAIQAAVLRESF